MKSVSSFSSKESSVGFAWSVLRGVLGEYALSGFHV